MLFFTFQFVPMVLYLIFNIFYSENFHQAQIIVQIPCLLLFQFFDKN
ncbi:hypothetical protein CUZ96_2696 [Enterococcus lactis]|nr:hypothetical protein [Enterococcus lactis]